MKKYIPTERQERNARALGVRIESAKNKAKKLDVYRYGRKVASIGARGYKDYDAWLAERGPGFAAERRRLYKIRHERDRHKIGSPGWYADKILW